MRGFFNSQVFTYIFVYFQVYYIFYILRVTILLLSFSYVLYFEFPIFPTSSYRLCLKNVLFTSLYCGASECISNTSDVIEGLMIFVVRYPSEWMNILQFNLFETAIHFAHSNDH